MTKMLKVVGASWLQTKISSYILGILGALSILALIFGQMERIRDDGNFAATVYYSEKAGYRIELWGQSNDLADIPRGVARAHFKREVDNNGWSVFEVETNGQYDDEIQAYAAGIVEGALTWKMIELHVENTIRSKCEDPKLKKQCNKLKDAIDKSVKSLKTHAAEHQNEDPFWHHVSLYYFQINGIFTGWKFGIARSEYEYDLDISELYWLNFLSEVPEIQNKLNLTIENSIFDQLPGMSSAFLRILNETNDDGDVIKKIFVAHNTAASYSSMTRILKRYKFNYHLTSAPDSIPAPGISVDFSGYPGSITSQDEFYLVKGDKHRMAITGTTLRNHNHKLWKDVNIFEQVPIGPRITAANHLASNVTSWTHIIAKNSSGTASKQWLVLDFERFDQLQNATLKVDVPDQKSDIVTESSVDNDVRHTVLHRPNSDTNDLLWLVEQIPGLTHARDESERFLEQGYFATYGLPLISDIADATHVTKMEEIHGKLFSWTESPRAVTFKRGFKNATSLESILELMRQNNMTAISADSDETPCQEDCIIKEKGYWSVLGVRGDVVSKYKEPYGVIDTKVIIGSTNSTLLDFVAISSPPFTKVANVSSIPINKGNVAYTNQFDNEHTINGIEISNLLKQQQEEAQQEALDKLNKDVLKPFQWSNGFKEYAHEGLPDKWDFGPFMPKWSW